MRIGLYNPFLAALGGGEKYALAILAEAVATPGACVELYAPRRPDPAGWERLGARLGPGAYEWVQADDDEASVRSRECDLLVAFTNDVPVRSHARHSVAMVQFPARPRERAAERVRATVAAAFGRRRAPAALRSYDLFLVNSEFTRGWTARRLGVDAVVLPPPVEPPRATGGGSPRGRERLILSVGRFFRGEHDKRQDVLVHALAELGADGWELHLVGGADPAGDGASRVAELRALAAGLPVTFHVDAPAAELGDLYARASLFWHAAGYGVDPERHPERLEHFGIATAEAMAAGAVPLIYPGGGQAEVVSDGVTGVHWRTPAELVARTRELIGDPARVEALRAAARERAVDWGRERFGAAVRELVLEPTRARAERVR